MPGDKRERIKALLLEGLSPSAVAVKVGTTVATAERYRRYGLPEIRESIEGRFLINGDLE